MLLDVHEATPPVIPAFPLRVVEARRSRGITVDQLARSCDLPVAVVAALEAGDDVAGEARTMIGRFLDLVDDGAYVPPVPLSNRHALLLHLVRLTNVGRKRHEAVPDARAWLAHDVEAVSTAPAADPEVTRLEAKRDRLLGGLRVLVCAEVAGLFLAYVSNGSVRYAVAGAFVVPLVTCAVLAVAIGKRLAALGRVADGEAADVAKRREEARPRTLSLLTERAFLLDARGIETVDVHGSTLVTPRQVKADEVFALRVEVVGPGHVTVHVRCVWGDITMPWLRGTRELIDTLRTIATRDDPPWTTVIELPSDGS